MAIFTLRTSAERHREGRGGRMRWRTFYPAGPGDPFAHGFGALLALDEERLPPKAALSREGAGGGETLTFVSEGALSVEEPEAGRSVIRAGGLQRGAFASARNASRTEWAHVLRLGLRGAGADEGGRERKLFTAADRRGRLLLLASPDGRDGSLRVPLDARLHAALLERGRHVVHELPPGRGAWLHVVQGEVALGGVVLSAGDGAGVTGSPALSLTAREPSSVLLVETADPPRSRLPGLSARDLFALLWDAITELLGPIVTAAVVRRAVLRALPRFPELGAIELARVEGAHRWALPATFDDGGPSEAMDALLDELRPILEELTGEVLLRRLALVPQLRDWASAPAPRGAAPARTLLSTGSAELDAILGGGLPAGSQIAVAGEPGTGKTLFALQLVFQCARQGRRAIYFSTLAEPSLKLLRQLQSFTFFDPAALGERVTFVDLETVVEGGDPAAFLRAITTRVEREEPALVVVDGVKSVRELIGPAEVRKLAFELGVHLAAWGATALMVGQYTDEEMAALPEFAVVDGVLRFGVQRGERETVRTVEVRKLRCASSIPGRHRFEIGPGGLTFADPAR